MEITEIKNFNPNVKCAFTNKSNKERCKAAARYQLDGINCCFSHASSKALNSYIIEGDPFEKAIEGHIKGIEQGRYEGRLEKQPIWLGKGILIGVIVSACIAAMYCIATRRAGVIALASLAAGAKKETVAGLLVAPEENIVRCP